MKKKKLSPVESPELSEERVRDRAYQLYEEGGREDGRAVENWLQAQSEFAPNQAN